MGPVTPLEAFAGPGVGFSDGLGGKSFARERHEGRRLPAIDRSVLPATWGLDQEELPL